MNIEPGKFYKLRNGCKAEIYSLGNEFDKCHGRYWPSQSDKPMPLVWDSKGYLNESGRPSGWDIIGPWTEPAPKLVLWRRKMDGYLCAEPEDTSPGLEHWERVDVKQILGAE